MALDGWGGTCGEVVLGVLGSVCGTFASKDVFWLIDLSDNNSVVGDLIILIIISNVK